MIARHSSFRYRGRQVDLREVGRELGVRYVLEGGIRRGGDRVRVTAQLVEAESGAQRWAERYDRTLEDVFAIQDEVARAIASVLLAHVRRAEAERTLALQAEIEPLLRRSATHVIDTSAQLDEVVAEVLQASGVRPD